MIEKYDSEFLLDEKLYPHITVTEAESLKPIQKKIMESYIKNREKMDIEEWLTAEMKNSFPEKSDLEVEDISKEIIETLKTSEEKQASFQNAIESGRSKESWFISETKKATSYMSVQETVKYLNNLDKALDSANEAFNKTIYTKAGAVSLSRNLDGFIAEQQHVQTFNLKAEATGSQYRAKVLQPDGNRYRKNSVDAVILDGKGKIVRRYQFKYCKDANETAKAFKKGDYRGQRKIVPNEQSIEKKSYKFIEAPDGTQSKPLTKQTAKELQNEAQSGNWNELNWKHYHTKDLALGIGKQAGQAALMGATIGIGFNVAQKVWNGEQIDGGEVAEAALTSGADFGVKVATIGALKVGAEKGIIAVIPKGTSAGTIANIANIVIENGKVIRKMATGELTIKEGLDKIEQTTMAALAVIAGQMLIPIPVVGAIIGTLVCKFQFKVYNYIKDTYGEIKEYKENAAKIENFANAALLEMEQQRLELKSMISEHLKEWDERFDRGFEQIFSSAFDNDADGIASGLDVILGAFGKDVRFKTASEFDDFFMDENAVLEF